MKKPRALVVDDEPDIRELLSITLERMNIEVVTAERTVDDGKQIHEGPNDADQNEVVSS